MGIGMMKGRRRTHEKRSRISEKHLRPRPGATCGRLRQHLHPNHVELRTDEH